MLASGFFVPMTRPASQQRGLTRSEAFPWLSPRLSLAGSRSFWTGAFIVILIVLGFSRQPPEPFLFLAGLGSVLIVFFVRAALRSTASIPLMVVAFAAAYLFVAVSGLVSARWIVFGPVILIALLSLILRRLAPAPQPGGGTGSRAVAGPLVRRPTDVAVLVLAASAGYIVATNGGFQGERSVHLFKALGAQLDKVKVSSTSYPVTFCAPIVDRGVPKCLHADREADARPDSLDKEVVEANVLRLQAQAARFGAGAEALAHGLVLQLGYAAMALAAGYLWGLWEFKGRQAVLGAVAALAAFEFWRLSVEHAFSAPANDASVVWKIALFAATGPCLLAGIVRARLLDQRLGLAPSPRPIGDSFAPERPRDVEPARNVG